MSILLGVLTNRIITVVHWLKPINSTNRVAPASKKKAMWIALGVLVRYSKLSLPLQPFLTVSPVCFQSKTIKETFRNLCFDAHIILWHPTCFQPSVVNESACSCDHSIGCYCNSFCPVPYKFQSRPPVLSNRYHPPICCVPSHPADRPVSSKPLG